VTPQVCYRIAAPPAEWDRLVGALHELGTLGIEEREDPPPRLVAYFPADDSAREGVLGLASHERRVRVTGPEPVPERDWASEWRRGLEPRRVGPLWIRPSWHRTRGTPELVLDPERAFGSGEHASTRLALILLLEALRPGDRVLDVGTGSGILALAALRAGARSALGLDVDPAACTTARRNARANRLRLDVVCATPAALRPEARFEVVVANLLVRELEPWALRLAGSAGRTLIVSGLLAEDTARLDALLAGSGLVTLRETHEADAGDRWVARRLTHTRDRQ
jgi:ribosomal protein L11 methyltransferase